MIRGRSARVAVQIAIVSLLSYGCGACFVLASWLQVFVHNFSTANYFALNEYTTVGSSLRMPQNLRLLEGMIAIAGLLAFAWSTGVLLTLAREFQARQMQRYEQLRQRPEGPPAPDATILKDAAKPG